LESVTVAPVLDRLDVVDLLGVDAQWLEVDRREGLEVLVGRVVLDLLIEVRDVLEVVGVQLALLQGDVGLDVVVVLSSDAAWKIVPMRRRAFCSALSPSALSTSPSTVTVPALGRSSRLMQRASVLLPAPLGPITPAIWPAGTCSETRSSTVCS
jgi:hypothetical protein